MKRKPLRIILDGSVVYQKQGAAYKYFQQMVPRLVETADLAIDVIPSPTGVLHFGQGIRPTGRFFRWLYRRHQYLRAFRWRLGGKSEPILFHSYYYTLPLVAEWTQIQVIHDLIAEKFESEYQSPHDRKLRERKRICIEQATRLVAVSENTRRDLGELLGVGPDRIDVVPQAIDANYLASPIAGDELNRTLARFGISRPYFLQVGGRPRHKNFHRLLEAYAASGLSDNYLLVCAGETFSPEEKEWMHRWGLRDRLRLAHWPAEEDLRALYRGARALIYPSFYEGFGLPPVEAMACGTVAAVARAASLPEVCGEAAVFFDPMDPADIARALHTTLDDSIVASLREKGRRQAAKFSWENAAAQTIEVYRKAISSN